MSAITIILIILGSLLGIAILFLVVWGIILVTIYIISTKHSDGSYIYDKSDFKEDGKTPQDKKLTDQKNEYEFNFDSTTLHYSIHFGKKRALKYGIIRIHHKGAWYSSHPHQNEKKLIFQERRESNTGYVKFHKLKGESKTISIEWVFEATSIRVVTHFSLFKNATLAVSEPDLKYSPTELKNINFIVFSIEFPDGLEDTATSNFDNPCTQFPRFFNDSPNRRMLSFQTKKFAPPSQKLISSTGPVTLFDENTNTMVISSIDQFMSHVTRVKGSKLRVSQFQCGLNGETKEIPKNHVSHYILTFNKGINDSIYHIGDILRSYHNKSRRSMSMDNFTTYLGYWTDNGARYYYKPLKKATLSETLILVDKYAEQTGIPLCNYNLDSWWYKKSVKKGVRTLLGPIGTLVGGGLYGGTLEWDNDPEYMHIPFKELKKQINKPLNAHGRWFNKDNVYKDDFPFITEGNKALCIEPEFWDMLMKQCKDYGIDNYEQDWMSNQFDNLSFLRNTVGTTKKWLKSMGDAAKKYDRTIEYCMTMSGMFLSSIYVDQVSFVRSCDDYKPQFTRNWDYMPFVQTNMLAYAVRAWPFKDVFLSKKSGSIFNREKQPELMALCSALSCGPVGPGDEIDEFGLETIFKTCRKDGYLIKPDKPLTAVDLMFIPHSKYFLASTYSDYEDLRWWYTIQSKLTLTQPKDPFFYPKDLGIDPADTTEFVAFNYFRDRIRKFSNIHPIQSYLKGQDYHYWIICPLLSDEFALIGDISKFASMSYQTFEKIEWKKNELKITMKSIAGEPLHLLFYDNDRIETIAVDGKKFKKDSLQWVTDSIKRTSLILHEFQSDICEVIVKVKK